MTDYTGMNASRIIDSKQDTSNATSAYVAANIADGLGVTLASRVVMNNEALSNQQQLMAANDTYLSKVSAIATDAVSRDDIVTYTVKDGDTVQGIASKYNITTQTLRWANGLTDNDIVNSGDKLTILPVNGVLYTVKSGDTPEGLAQRYKANAVQIVSFNDAELEGLKPGSKIVIPDGTLPESERPQAPAPSPATSFFAHNFVPQYGGNGYVYGYCTWYVASRISVPSNWGNANTWASRAASSGWRVSTAPTPGAIAQRSGGWGGLGHVAIVEEVSPDGSRVKISDMNGFAGWGQVGSGWVSIGEYIYITK